VLKKYKTKELRVGKFLSFIFLIPVVKQQQKRRGMETFYHPFSKIKNKTSLSQIKSLHLQLLFSFIFRDFRSRGRGGKPITTEV